MKVAWAAARMVGSGFTILLLALVLAPQLKITKNLGRVFLLTAMLFLVIGVVSFAITFVTSKENVFRTVGAVLYTGPFGPMVTRKLGKKRGFLIACTTAGLAGRAFIFFNTAVPSLWLSLASLFLLGVSMGMLNTMTWALEADTVEYGEYKTGIHTEGATYSAFSFTRTVGQALGVAVAGQGLALGVAVAGQGLALAGYDGLRDVQPPETLNSMVWAFGLLPTVIFLLAAVVRHGYPSPRRSSARSGRRSSRTGCCATSSTTGARRPRRRRQPPPVTLAATHGNSTKGDPSHLRMGAPMKFTKVSCSLRA